MLARLTIKLSRAKACKVNAATFQNEGYTTEILS
jgi:hypothetical protein